MRDCTVCKKKKSFDAFEGTRESDIFFKWCIECKTSPANQTRRAYSLFAFARNKGFIEPLPCRCCGTTVKVQAHHHWGYYEPLDVVWLCIQHHHDAHVRMRAAKRVKPLPKIVTFADDNEFDRFLKVAMRVGQVAKVLDVSVTTVTNLAAKGRLGYAVIAGWMLYDPADVELERAARAKKPKPWWILRDRKRRAELLAGIAEAV